MRWAKLLLGGIICCLVLFFPEAVWAECDEVWDGEKWVVTEDCKTVGAACNESKCGAMPPPLVSSGSPSWECKTQLVCKVTTAWDEVNQQFRCSASYAYDQQCIAVDFCCDGTGGSEKVCYRSCQLDVGCVEGSHYKTCCKTDGSYGTCGITVPYSPSCSTGTVVSGTSCTGGPTVTPGGPSPTTPPDPGDAV